MTPKNIDPNQIVMLLKDNISPSEIAKILSVSRSNISYWIKKLNLNNNLPKRNWEEIQTAYDNGATYKDICKLYNISTVTLTNASKKGIFNKRIKVKLGIDEAEKKRKGIARECWARYHAKKKYQTPSDEDLKLLQNFYANCPKGYEVDHIIPISKGGLHTLSNLQYLTIKENRSKGNKLI